MAPTIRIRARYRALNLPNILAMPGVLLFQAGRDGYQHLEFLHNFIVRPIGGDPVYVLDQRCQAVVPPGSARPPVLLGKGGP